jgi:hypothetical protein
MRPARYSVTTRLIIRPSAGAGVLDLDKRIALSKRLDENFRMLHGQSGIPLHHPFGLCPFDKCHVRFIRRKRVQFASSGSTACWENPTETKQVKTKVASTRLCWYSWSLLCRKSRFVCLSYFATVVYSQIRVAVQRIAARRSAHRKRPVRFDSASYSNGLCDGAVEN